MSNVAPGGCPILATTEWPWWLAELIHHVWVFPEVDIDALDYAGRDQ